MFLFFSEPATAARQGASVLGECFDSIEGEFSGWGGSDGPRGRGLCGAERGGLEGL